MPKLIFDDMIDQQEFLERQLRDDPEFRAEWERTAVAREVALLLVGYRARHNMTQAELADRIGMKQPQVARIEGGDVNPTIDTLKRIADALDVEIAIDVTPANKTPRFIRSSTGTKRLAGVLVIAG